MDVTRSLTKCANLWRPVEKTIWARGYLRYECGRAAFEEIPGRFDRGMAAAVDLTLMSAIYFAREVLPGMQRRKWGRLITITSMSVKQPVDGLILSNSIRAAVTGLARTLANEFGADGITVNNVAPGYTLTDRLEELAAKRAADAGVSKEKVLEQMRASVPARRVGRPEEFAAAVAFLASERASYLNGTTIAVDGGWVRSLL